MPPVEGNMWQREADRLNHSVQLKGLLFCQYLAFIEEASSRPTVCCFVNTSPLSWRHLPDQMFVVLSIPHLHHGGIFQTNCLLFCQYLAFIIEASSRLTVCCFVNTSPSSWRHLPDQMFAQGTCLRNAVVILSLASSLSLPVFKIS